MLRPISIALIASALLLIGLGVLEMRYIERSARHMVVQIDRLETATVKGDWGMAKRELRRVEHEWSRTKNKWTIFLHHSEIDMLSMSVARADGFVRTENRTMLLSEVSSMKAIVEHIPGTEKITLSNIF